MCPICKSSVVSRSRKRKFADALMRWMGKTPYRCRDCQRRFYVNAAESRRLERDIEWRRRSEEQSAQAHQSGASKADSFS